MESLVPRDHLALMAYLARMEMSVLLDLKAHL